MVVADTSVWIDFFNGAPSPERATLRGLVADSPSQLIVPDLVMFEVLRGFRHERQARQALAAFQALNVQSVVDAAAAQRAAERYQRLRTAGVTVHSAIDVLVASYCIDHDLILLQRDRDFLPFEQHFGLRLLAPCTEPIPCPHFRSPFRAPALASPSPAPRSATPSTPS